MDLAAYQDAFAAALMADNSEVSPSPMVERLRRQPGFAVYRNTVMKGCIDALQANFPAVERLVGEEWLRAAASVFARGQLPSQPSLLLYGEDFPSFLAAFEPAQEIPYLADVARVDRLWTEAHVAADAPVLAAAALAALPPSEMSSTRLRLHPAARWAWSEDWPIHTLWSRNRSHDADPGAPMAWVGQGVLVTRPLGPVQVEAFARGGVALLDACRTGLSIEGAVQCAFEAQPDVDFAAVVQQLLQAGAFGGLQPIVTKEST
jgi:Putative DNA-binding domain